MPELKDQKNNWYKLQNKMIYTMIHLEKVFKGYIQNLKQLDGILYLS
jgi:hypothetical protein